MWPYSDPIVGFHRYLDSMWVKDWQQPIRTVRAFQSRVAVGAKYDRIYMRIGGGMLAAYDLNTFTQRLQSREELIAGARRTTLTGQFEGYDLYLRPDRFFYPENSSAGWVTPLTDGQERLYAFDWDDRGYVYMAYTHFGWGIARDDGGTGGSLMQSVFQSCGDPDRCVPASNKLYDTGAPNNLFVVKTSQGRYLVFVAEIIEPVMKVYDVTDPANPVRQIDFNRQVSNISKMGNYIALVGAGGVEIYTNDAFVSRQSPFTTVTQNGYTVRAVTTDGTRYYAAAMKGGKLGIFTIDMNGSTATTTVAEFGNLTPSSIAAHGGYLAIYGIDQFAGDVLLFRVNSGVPEEIPLNKWVQQYYVKPPSGYVRPPSDQTSFYYASPLKVGSKLFIMLSVYALGDVIEIKSEDSIVAARTGAHATGDVFYGDKVDFVATTASATPKSVVWDFGNPESGVSNSTITMTAQPAPHVYAGLSSATPLTRSVKAVSGPSDSIVSVTLKPPAARFRILGSISPSLLFTQPNASSPAPIVLGDVFVDQSDGDIAIDSGHVTTWSIDTQAVTKSAGSTVDVGVCGQHELIFTASYGTVASVTAVPPTYPVTISPFRYTVRPFAASMKDNGHTATHLNFITDSRGGTGHPGSTLTHQWDLVNSSDLVILAGGTSTTFSVPKTSVAPGSRVRLKVKHPTTPTGDCASMTESVAYSEVFNPPNPVITGGCASGGNPPCTFTAASATGASTAGWSFSWSVTGGTYSASSTTSSTFSPTFTQTATYTVSLTASNAISAAAATPVQVAATAASLCPDMVPGVNIFLSYAGTGCSQNGGSCAPGQTIFFSVGSFLNYSMLCATHTFLWSISGQQYTTQNVPNIVLPSGSHQVSVVVSNGRETKTMTATVNVGTSVTPPPPTPPPPTPSPGGCGAMTTANVFVAFAAPNNACNELNPQNCPANQAIVFNAGAVQFGASGYSFACATHSFNWTIEGQPKTGQSVSHTFTSGGQKAISLTINNGSQSFTTGATLTVAGGGGTTPPTPPPPGGSCPTMNAVNVFIAYNDALQSCNQNNPTAPCPAGQLIDFRASGFNYNFGCSTHAYSWEFPGGVIKTGQSVQHSFSNGNHTVKLKVMNSAQTYDTQAAINVGGAAVEPEFLLSIAKELLVPGTAIYRFTPVVDPPAAASSIQTYVWDLGNGAVRDIPSPGVLLYEYIPACPSCSVTLTVKDALGRAIAPPVTAPLTPSRRRSAPH